MFFLSFFLSFGRGMKGNGGKDLYRIYEWYSQKKKKFSVPNRVLQTLNKHSVSKTKFDQNLFSYVTLYFTSHWAELIPFFWYCSSTQICYYSAFTFWNCILILKEPLYCIVGVAFLFVFYFSFYLMWSSTAPCCPNIIFSHIKNCILRSFKPWLHDRCAKACFIFQS